MKEIEKNKILKIMMTYDEGQGIHLQKLKRVYNPDNDRLMESIFEDTFKSLFDEGLVYQMADGFFGASELLRCYNCQLVVGMRQPNLITYCPRCGSCIKCHS